MEGESQLGFLDLFKTPQVEERQLDESQIDDVLLQALLMSEAVSVDEAMSIPALASCIDQISDAVAMLPIKLYKEADGKVEEIQDGRITLLNDETGDTLDGFQFKKALVSDYLTTGAGYVYIKRKRNTVQSLHYVESSYITIQKNSDPIFKAYDVLVNGHVYRDFDFFKIARKTKDGATGVGIVAEHNKLLSVVYNTLIFEELLVKTGGNKKGFLKAQNKLSDDAIKTLKAAWAKLYQNNKENIVVLNNGLEFQEASSTSVEMQLNENKKTNADEIYRIFKMPEGKLTDEAIETAIFPVLIAIQSALNKDLLLPSEKKASFYFAFDTKKLLKGDLEKRFKAYEIAVKNGFMQIDEVRYEEDLEPLNLGFIKLGLQDVLYNIETGEIYTPNTNKTSVVEAVDSPAEGGEKVEN